MRSKRIRLLAALCSVFIFTGALSVNTETIYAGEELYYKSAEIPETDYPGMISAEIDSSVPVASGVTEEMCRYGYWTEKNKGSEIDPDSTLISKSEILTLNRAILDDAATNMHDLEGLSVTYNARSLRDRLKNVEIPNKPNIYADTVSVSKNDYYGEVGRAIESSGYSEESRENQYAVAVKRTTMLSVPTKAYIGYSQYDTDNENAVAALNVNEPFVIRQKATVFGDDFYWGYSNNCTGWVSADDLAVCTDREQWTDAWKTDINKDDFIVITQNNITLEPSYYTEYLSEVKLTFGTILKLVPEEAIPSSIGERGPWNNYVVYLPVRNNAGNYEKKCALISHHYEVSRGYLKMTQSELLRVAFNNLGDRYGWGGMLDSMDCTLFTRNVYKCFGLELPRNTTWQKEIPGKVIDLSGMSDERKLTAISRMPAGTLLFFKGHMTIYTGTDNKMAYVISDTGSVSDSEGALNVRSMYSVILNPLSVRRRDGTTWLKNITAAIIPVSEENFKLIKGNVESGKAWEPEAETKRVPIVSGQSFVSSRDTLGLDTFTGSIKNLYISFANVEGAGVEELTATCIKGSKISTKEPVSSIECDKKTAKVKINKGNGTAGISMKASGNVVFNMADGKSYTVFFTVDKPKPQKNKVKEYLNSSKDAVVSLNPALLFGTDIDSGTLKIKKNRTGNASVSDNCLQINTGEKTSVKICYEYLNKKYNMSLKYDNDYK